MILVQKGRNDNYPVKIETWMYGETVPEWLSDKAKVVAIDEGTGNPMLDMIETTTGGYELKNSDGISALVKTNDRYDYVCHDPVTDKIFSLSKLQISLLYNSKPL